eukprot:Lankesteria_metandrocarpae@DN4670_c0_g1_i2.p1
MQAGEQPSAEVQPEAELPVLSSEAVQAAVAEAFAEFQNSPQYDALRDQCFAPSVADVNVAASPVEQPLSSDSMNSENGEVSVGNLSTGVVVSAADQLDGKYACKPEVVSSYGFADLTMGGAASNPHRTRGTRAKRVFQLSEKRAEGSLKSRDDLLFWAAKAKRNLEKNTRGTRGVAQNKRHSNDGVDVFSDSSASEQGDNMDSNSSCASNDSCVATVSGKTNFALGAKIAAALAGSAHGNALRLSFGGIQGDLGMEKVKRRTERRRRNAERLRRMTQAVKNRVCNDTAALHQQVTDDGADSIAVSSSAATAVGLAKCHDVRLRSINNNSRSSDAPIMTGRKRVRSTAGDPDNSSSTANATGGKVPTRLLKKMKLASKCQRLPRALPFGFCTQEELNAEPTGMLESIVSLSKISNDTYVSGGVRGEKCSSKNVRVYHKQKNQKSKKDRPESELDLFCEGFSTAPDVVKEQYLASCKRSVTKEFILLQKRRDRGEIDNCSFERQKDRLMAQVVPAPENPVPEHLRRMWVAESPTPTQEPSDSGAGAKSWSRGTELFRRREKLLRVSRAIDQRAPPSERLEHRDTSFSDMSMAEKLRLERSWRFWPIHGERFEAFGWNFAQPTHPLFKHPERYPRC